MRSTIKTVLGVVAALAIYACAAEKSDPIGVKTSLLTEEQGRVLGFESPQQDWSALNGSPVSSSNETSQGQGSLALQPNGYTEVQSVEINAPGDALTAASLDIQLPQQVSWGEVRLVAKIPSAGMHWRDLGGAPLSGLSADEFHPLSFNIPSDVQDALSGSASDVRFSVIINTQSGVGEILLDNLLISSAGGGDPNQEPGSSATESIVISLPRDVEPADLALSASGELTIDDRCEIGVSSESTTIASLGGEGAHLGSAAVVHGDVISRTNALLRSQAVVNGGVSATGTIDFQDNTVVVNGEVAEGVITRTAQASWRVDWPTGNLEDLSLPVDSPNLNLVPGGGYGSLQVYSRATVTLRAGNYYFDSFIAEPEAKLQVDTSQGPVVIYIRDEIRLRAPLDYVAGPEGEVLFVYLGESPPTLFESALVASVVAPNATLELRRPNTGGAHVGSFFAKDIHVFSDSRVEHQVFPFSSLCAEGSFASSGCNEHKGSPSTSSGSSILLPQGVAPSQVAVAARTSIVVGNGASVEAEDRVVAVAEGGATVGAATVPSLVTAEGGTLQAGAVVNGDLLSAQAFQVEEGATVAGSIDPSAAVVPPVSYPIDAVFPPPAEGNVLVADGRSKIIWPGNYGTITVESGGKAYLTSGRYFINHFSLADGSELVVNSSEGWVKVAVASTLNLGADVSPLGLTDAELLITYFGVSPVQVRGEFAGGLIAPRATVSVEGGPHLATLYADSLYLAENTQVTPNAVRWDHVIPVETNAEIVVTPKVNLPGSLPVNTNEGSTSFNDPSGFNFALPGRIPVSYGNAGDGVVQITFDHALGTEICTYRGGSNVSHPTSLLEIARGLEYVLEGCSGSSEAGDLLDVTSLTVSITGDTDAERVGVTGINLPIDTGCGGILPAPMSPGQSREWIEDSDYPSLFPGQYPFPPPSLLVPETINGEPSLFYAAIYVSNEEELAMLDQLLIHWDKRPLFTEEWPVEWNNTCGTIEYPHDGEGTWVWAAIPGRIYNLLIQVQLTASVPSDERHVFRSVKLLDPPEDVAGSEGSLDVHKLRDSGFQFLQLTGYPDDAALDDALFSSKPGRTIVSAAKWIWDRGKDFTRGTAIFFGLADRIYGTVDVDIDLNVMNTDDRFADADPDGNTIPMLRHWGPRAGTEIAPEDILVMFWTRSVRPTNPLPVRRLSVDKLNYQGKVRLKVAGQCEGTWGGLCGSVDFQKVQYELENRAGFVTGALFANSVNDDTWSDNFYDDISVERDMRDWNLSALTEITDSHDYLYSMTGEKAKKAKLLIGGEARFISGSEMAWAPCLGYGDLVAESALALALAIPEPTISAIAVTRLSYISTSDIIVTPDYEGKYDRGLLTHEYGHYALCDLIRSVPGSFEGDLEDTVLNFDTIRGGPGSPDAGEDARIVNEAFADFFAGQVAGGYNYFTVEGAVSGWVNISQQDPGLDDNLWNMYNVEDDHHIGRLATMLQDLYDGRPHRSDGPSSGESWISSDSQIYYRGECADLGATSPDCTRSGDTDLEEIALGGGWIKEWVNEFSYARNLVGHYSVDAVEEATANVALRGSNWCQACLLMAPHFANYDPDVPGDPIWARDMIDDCQEGQLEEMLGSPPSDIRERNALTCEPCPAGWGMERDGTCVECPTDIFLTWAGTEECRVVELTHPLPQPPNLDLCPQSLIVELTAATNGPFPATHVGMEMSNDIDNDLVCAASVLSGEIEGGAAAGTLQTLMSFEIEGQPCSPDGDDDICLEQCRYPHASGEQPLPSAWIGTPVSHPLSTYRHRLTVDGGGNSGGGRIVIVNDSGNCAGIVVR